MFIGCSLTGKFGIRIPSHNSLTPSLFDELMKTASTSRKLVAAAKIRRRLSEKYHLAIISTGLSYLAYLGALRKTGKGYKPTRIGKKIGKLLAKDQLEEANTAWAKLLERHRLYGVFRRYLRKGNDTKTIQDFGFYLKKRGHAKWDVSSARSRLSRLCELFADKGLIEYQNGHLSPIETRDQEPSSEKDLLPTLEYPSKNETAIQKSPQSVSFSAGSWPIKIDIRIEISDKANPKIFQMILSFLKEMREKSGELKVGIA